MGAIITNRGYGRGGYGRPLRYGHVFPGTETADAPLWRKPGRSLSAPAIARRHDAQMRQERKT